MRRSTLRPERGGELVRAASQIAADQGEQIAGLGERVVPDRVVALAAVERAALDQIAVRQQHGRLGGVRLDAHGEGRQHVRPVEEIGDAAEALRLALGAVDAARQVEPGQRLVGVGVAIADGLERKGALRRPRNGEVMLAELIGAALQAPAVDLDRLRARAAPHRAAGARACPPLADWAARRAAP